MRKTIVHMLFVLLFTTVLSIQPVSAEKESVSSEYIPMENGKTAPVYSYEEAVKEIVFIETNVDSDQDGERDRIRANIIRPKETEEGLRVPVIYEMSPYRAGLNFPLEFYDVDVQLHAAEHSRSSNGAAKSAVGPSEPSFPGYYDNYFVPRGYAVVLAESLGSGLSNGCATTGGENETIGTTAVIDWLNGRADAYDQEGNLVEADWSTGQTGMIGVSYNGTLPNAAAATGVEGLKTIVPIAAISSWYDYYRANGAVVAPGGYQGEDTDVLAKAVTTRENADECNQTIDRLTELQERQTGDYNEFWDERNYVNHADKVEASVLAVHGLNDWNVKTKQVSQWWKALEENGVERKLWLHQSGHTDPYYLRQEEWLDTLNKWFDHWLYDIENGIMDEPMVDIQREDLNWETYETWPAKTAKTVSFRFQDNSLGLKPMKGNKKFEATFVDDASITAENLAAQPSAEHENRLVFETTELGSDLRISGTPEVSIQASIDAKAANLTALLVDYAPDGELEIVTRGWMDPQNRHKLSKTHAILPGKDYKFTWAMQPDDYIFEKGHRIGVVILSSDHDYTLHPEPGTKISVNPKHSRLILPVDGGKKAIDF